MSKSVRALRLSISKNNYSSLANLCSRRRQVTTHLCCRGMVDRFAQTINPKYQCQGYGCRESWILLARRRLSETLAAELYLDFVGILSMFNTESVEQFSEAYADGSPEDTIIQSTYIPPLKRGEHPYPSVFTPDLMGSIHNTNHSRIFIGQICLLRASRMPSTEARRSPHFFRLCRRLHSGYPDSSL